MSDKDRDVKFLPLSWTAVSSDVEGLSFWGNSIASWNSWNSAKVSRFRFDLEELVEGVVLGQWQDSGFEQERRWDFKESEGSGHWIEEVGRTSETDIETSRKEWPLVGSLVDWTMNKEEEIEKAKCFGCN